MAKQQTTTKKVKVIGTQQYVNTATGEVLDFQVNEIEERDFNFTKIWMKSLISTMELVGNQKTRLAYWLIDNLDKENKITLTLRQISAKTGISLETVRLTMKILMDADFLRRINISAYIVNPDIVFRGTRGARLNILNIYKNEAEHVVMTDEEKIKNYQSSIKYLQEKINKLEMKKAIKASDGQYYVQPTVISEDEEKEKEKEKATAQTSAKN